MCPKKKGQKNPRIVYRVMDSAVLPLISPYFGENTGTVHYGSFYYTLFFRFFFVEIWKLKITAKQDICSKKHWFFTHFTLFLS